MKKIEPQRHEDSKERMRMVNRTTKTQSHEDEKRNFKKATQTEEEIISKIVDSAFAVHKTLGPGLLEKIYEVCFCHELNKRGLSFQRQVSIPIEYDEIRFDEGLRIDCLVEGIIVCELKSAEQSNAVWEAQLLTYLKLTGKHLGLLINFNVPVIKKGIKRMIL